MYCQNLGHNKIFECKVNKELELENAGACMLANFNGKKIIVENCPRFEQKRKLN